MTNKLLFFYVIINVCKKRGEIWDIWLCIENIDQRILMM